MTDSLMLLAALDRPALFPYVRCMLTLSRLHRTCGIVVSSQGTVGITSPAWMHLPALLLYRACAAHVAALL